MADQATTEEQRLKQRAMRRLAVALGFIAAAIVGLAVLDRYTSRSPAKDAGRPGYEPPAVAALPPPKPIAPPPAPALDAPQVEPPPPSVEDAPSDAGGMRPAPPSSAGATRPEAAATDAGRSAQAAPAPPPTAAPAAAPPRTAAPLLPAPAFVVQLGMFSSVDNAQSLLERLRAQGVPAYLETRVVVGPFRDRAEAEAAQRKLQATGVSGVIAQRK